jgi:hypothetical protein
MLTLAVSDRWLNTRHDLNTRDCVCFRGVQGIKYGVGPANACVPLAIKRQYNSGSRLSETWPVWFVRFPIMMLDTKPMRTAVVQVSELVSLPLALLIE